ncbi:MAG: hypothetical protein HZB13_07890 [Acidobacteria bacterium]|nr:hypothetical protein [Acidobacteriota bacterium]
MRLFIAALCAVSALAQAPDFRGSYSVPLTEGALRYADPLKDDPITRLQARIDSGETRLEWDAKFGYLPSLLKALAVPVSSQALVFSKTSFQLSRISPSAPRAIYFNDSVYLGYVHGGEVMELSAVDPERGGMFFTILQKKTAKPRLERGDACLQCHVSPNTTGIPGHLVRSVYADPEGYPLMTTGSFVTDHRSPFAERWGGWFVTGTHGRMRHMGNVQVADRDNPEKFDRETGANLLSLDKRFDVSRYLTPHSDIVALMVLEHQTKLHNLFTRAGFEVRSALILQAEMNKALGKPEAEMSDSTRRRIENSAEILVRYLLFADEFKLDSPVKGTSSFTSDFPALGPKDAKGRSLRDFDLQTRLFRYPCSYLIYSEAFAALPAPLKQRVWARINDVLSGKDQSAAFAALSAADRRNIREVLDATAQNIK